MAADLCDRCGTPLPNAAGPGLYCPGCGEPVRGERDDREPVELPDNQLTADWRNDA